MSLARARYARYKPFRPVWIALFFIFIVVSIAHARYFAWTVGKALVSEWPASERFVRWGRWVYMAFACSIPIFLACFAAYFFIVRPPKFDTPQNGFIDVVLLYPFWVATIWSFQCTLFIFPVGVGHWLARRFGYLRSPRAAMFRHRFVLVVAGAFLVYVPVRLVLDTNSVELRKYEYKAADLAPELEGLRIALIADPQADRHVDAPQLENYAEAIRDAKADLIVVAGDIINRDPAYIDTVAKMLASFKPRYGVFACIGDHDNFAYQDRERSVREVTEGLAKRGIPMLDNQVHEIEIGDSTLGLILATNNYVTRIDPSTFERLVAGADEYAITLLCSHQTNPKLLTMADKAGVDLFLSGHTHGGQVNFWLPIGELVLTGFESKFISGRYSWGNLDLIVSSGFGTSIAPLRYRSPGSVDVITLRRE